MVYSYERVPVTQQDKKGPEMALNAFNIDSKYIDVGGALSGERPKLEMLLKDIKPGDTLVVDSIGKIATSTKNFIELIAKLESKHVTFISMAENINTNTPEGKTLLSVLAALDRLEKDIALEKVKEGVENARKYGTKSGNRMGRPPAKLPDNFEKYYKQVESGKMNKSELARKLKVTRSTVYRWIEIYENEKSRED